MSFESVPFASDPANSNVYVRWPETIDVPLLLSFPHSGDVYPADFGCDENLPYAVIDHPSDKYVDELYANAQAPELPMIKANFPRTYIDVNRHQHDIDAEMLEDPGTWYGRLQPTAVRDGSTLFWSLAKETAIYKRKLSNVEAKRRLATCHTTYHQAMTTMIETMRRQFGRVFILDCHSMMQRDTSARGGGPRPEIDVGTRFGQSCAPELADMIRAAFARRGYDVGDNRRFAGGEITLRYGWPEIDQHVVQIEIRRDLYMNEETREKTDRFEQLQQDCSAVLTEFRTFLKTRLTQADPAA